MSLINQMLADLEARKGGNLRHVDSALDGLHPATPLGRHAHEHSRLLIGSLLCVLAFAALWSTREPLLDLLIAHRPVPALPPAVSSVTPTAPALPASPPPPMVLDAAGELPPTPVVVLDAPPLAPLAAAPPAQMPETAPKMPPAPLEPRVPAMAQVAPPAVPADLGPIYLEDEAAVVTPDESRVPLVAAEPTVEYRGSFRREQSTTPAATPEARRYAEIESLFANGRRDEALPMLRSFVSAQPAREDARLRLALELIAARQTAEADAVLRAGLRLAPKSPRLARPLAHLLLAQGNAQAALDILRPATPPLAGETDFHALLAAAEQRVGAHGLAIARYRGLLKEQPLNGSWLVALGISLLAVGEDGDAMSAFARALDDRALPEALRAFATRELVRLKDRQR